MTDTTAISYLQSNTISAGNTTEAAPSRKTITCTELSQRYVLLPVAIECHGSNSKKSADFISELWRRITAITLDLKVYRFLFQKR